MEDGLHRGHVQRWASAVSGASNVARTNVRMSIRWSIPTFSPVHRSGQVMTDPATQIIDHGRYDRAAELTQPIIPGTRRGTGCEREGFGRDWQSAGWGVLAIDRPLSRWTKPYRLRLGDRSGGPPTPPAQ